VPDDLFSLLEEEKVVEEPKKKKKKGFLQLGDTLAKYQLKDKGGYITKEFQDYGFQLAVKLNDLKHKSLYFRMAKTVDRAILERALAFVSDAHTAKSKARLFMWKVKQLKEERKKKETAANEKKS
jgi:hypothetical protein